jgi:hypothetical protein
LQFKSNCAAAITAQQVQVSERLGEIKSEIADLEDHLGAMSRLIQVVPSDITAMKRIFSGDGLRSMKTLFSNVKDSISECGAFSVMPTSEHLRYLFHAGYELDYLDSGVNGDIWKEENISSCCRIFETLMDENIDINVETTRVLFQSMVDAVRSSKSLDEESVGYTERLRVFDKLEATLDTLTNATPSQPRPQMTTKLEKILTKMKMFLLTGTISKCEHGKFARDLVRKHSENGKYLLIAIRYWRDDIEGNTSVTNASGQIKVAKQNLGMKCGAENFPGHHVRVKH